VQEGTVDGQRVQEREEGRGRVLQPLIERQHLPGHLGPNRAEVVVILHMRVALEQIDHREVWRGPAIGHRRALQDQPVPGAVRVDHLVHQARLAHARLPDARHHLAVPAPCPLECLMERFHLGLAPDKSGEAARHRGLQAPAGATRPNQLEDLDGLDDSLDRHGAQGLDLH
jgi:hypothetical protein